MANVYVGRIGHSGALARWCLRMSLARLRPELHHPGEAAGELPPVKQVKVMQVCYIRSLESF